MNKWLALSSVGFQIGAIVFLLSWLGKKLDLFFDTPKPYFAIGFSFLAVLFSVYSLINTLKKLNK